MSPTILHLRKTPGAQVVRWIQLLDGCAPQSRAAIAVYRDAAVQGLVDELLDGLRRAAAADRREADLLDAEKGAA